MYMYYQRASHTGYLPFPQQKIMYESLASDSHTTKDNTQKHTKYLMKLQELLSKRPTYCTSVHWNCTYLYKACVCL